MATPTAPGHQRACCCGAIHLSEREIDVLCKLAGGNTSAETAQILRLSRRTVDSHVGSMLRKAGVRNRGELLALAVGHEMIDMSSVPPSWTGRSCLPAPAQQAQVGPALSSGR
jgi:DNA-binding CsgD family transcriptional regulator